MISQHVIEQSRAVVVGLALAGCAAGFPAGEDPGALVPSASNSTVNNGLTGIAGTTGTETPAIGVGTSAAQPGQAGTTRAGTGGGAGVIGAVGMTGAADAGTRTGTARAGRGGSGGGGAAGMDRVRGGSGGSGAAGMRGGSAGGDAGLDGAVPDSCQRLGRCCSSVRDNNDQDACRTISRANDAAACDGATAMYCN
jgi:hypothetical protein